MKKIFFIFSIFLLFTMPVCSQTLKGGVEYTVDSARIIAFDNTEMSINMDEYKDYQTDCFNLSHVYDIKRGVYKNRASYNPYRVVPFYFKKVLVYYGIQYDKTPDKKFYYNKNGKLLKFDICHNSSEYPYKALSYDRTGKLISVHLAVSPTESFLFDKNKKLIGHWLNNQFYNADGKKGITRHL